MGNQWIPGCGNSGSKQEQKGKSNERICRFHGSVRFDFESNDTHKGLGV
jgi:hypothetical protein